MTPYSPPKGTTPSNKGRRLPAEPLSTDEARALIRAPSRRAPTGVRNAALLAVLWGGGLRIEEALALRPADWDDGTCNLLRILHGKGDRDRNVALAPEAVPYLIAWLERRAQHGLNGRHRLFSTLEGRPLHASYVRTMIKRMAKRAGIDKRVHPHGLRHSHACELRRRGVDYRVIQGQLGHARLETTIRYLEDISPTDRAEAIIRAWPAEEGNGAAEDILRDSGEIG